MPGTRNKSHNSKVHFDIVSYVLYFLFSLSPFSVLFRPQILRLRTSESSRDPLARFLSLFSSLFSACRASHLIFFVDSLLPSSFSSFSLFPLWETDALDCLFWFVSPHPLPTLQDISTLDMWATKKSGRKEGKKRRRKEIEDEKNREKETKTGDVNGNKNDINE